MTDDTVDTLAHRDYRENGILSAPPFEIVHLFYQVAIDNLNTANACLKSGDDLGRSRAVTKAQTAVYELLAALDPTASPSLCRTLAELYDYVQREIIAGHTQRSERAFTDALAVLTTLSEGWSGVRAHEIAKNQSADGESLIAPERQTEAAQEKEIGHLFAAPPQDPGTAQDWSC
jgi:flagellar biosynthetic protein FliS